MWQQWLAVYTGRWSSSELLLYGSSAERTSRNKRAGNFQEGALLRFTLLLIRTAATLNSIFERKKTWSEDTGPSLKQQYRHLYRVFGLGWHDEAWVYFSAAGDLAASVYRPA
jgi:hypothetical protein